MIYTQFQNERLSQLGFGLMRLPLIEGTKEIDIEQMQRMVDLAISKGVNYFDTAWPYHEGKSELAIAKCLAKYPRDSWYLADKFPGHQLCSSYDSAEVFEKQLEKCQVEYFDFYLLHNVCENSLPTYEDPRWGLIDYFIQKRKEGKIRHLGFSSHAKPETLRYFLEKYGKDMEFCQIQFNYVDWTLQDAKQKIEILNEFNIPVWVMEPLRGGKLCNVPALGDSEQATSMAFRWLLGFDCVKMILSGMSKFDQMEKNLETFYERKPLSAEEGRKVLEVAEQLKDSVPCTACRYCTEGCPMGLDIPALIASYNDMKFNPASFTVGMRLDSQDPKTWPDKCVRCGHCAMVCPQKIDIPQIMNDFAQLRAKSPSWSKICKEREEAALRLKAASQGERK